jgi:hypothetical protein
MTAPRRAPRPSQILEYHEQMLEALRVLGRRFEEVNEDAKSPFFGFRRQAFDVALELLRAELDAQVVLMLVASIEAVVRDDYAARLPDPTKTAVHERFRILDKTHADKLPFTEILDVWKEEAQIPEEVGMVKQLYVYRHWLAHGRRFTNKSGVQAYPRSSKNVIESFVAAIRQHTPDFPRR